MNKEFKKATFTVKVPVDPDDKDKGEKEVSLDVVQPNLKQAEDAQLYRNKCFRKYISAESQAPLRAEVNRILKDRGVWNEEKEAAYKKLSEEMEGMIAKLWKGGKLLDCRKLAIDIGKKRLELTNMRYERNALDANTAEAQADQAMFSWYVANCTLYTDSGELFFAPSVEDNGTTIKPSVKVYLEQANTRVAIEAARQFGMLQYGLEPDFEKKNPENIFLLKYKFVNDKLQLINRDGHLVDENFDLVDDTGWHVDANEVKVDSAGNKYDKDGNFIPPESVYIEEEMAVPA
jgi:hypothetical protein